MAKIRGSLWLALLAGLLVIFSSSLGVTNAQADLFVGNFFGSDSGVLRYDGTTGAFKSVFVPFNSGGLTFPLGGSFGPDGNLYVSNSDGENVLRYNGTTGDFINTFVSGVEDPAGQVFRGGFLHVANSADPGAVTRYNAISGVPDPPPEGFFVTPGSGGLANPEGLVFGPDGNLYVAPDGGGILRYNGTTGAFIDAFVPMGTLTNARARGVAFGPDGNLYVTDFGGGTVVRFDGTTGAFIDNFVTAGSGGLSDFPRPLVFGPDGNLYVGDYTNGSVLRYDGITGAFIDAFVPAGSGGLGGPTFLVFDGGVPIPLPGSLLLLGSGLLGLGGWRRFRKG